MNDLNGINQHASEANAIFLPMFYRHFVFSWCVK